MQAPPYPPTEATAQGANPEIPGDVLIRIDPDPILSARWFAAENLLPRTQDDGGYAWHAMLSSRLQ